MKETNRDRQERRGADYSIGGYCYVYGHDILTYNLYIL